jgi:hypothetical protein
MHGGVEGGVLPSARYTSAMIAAGCIADMHSPSLHPCATPSRCSSRAALAATTPPIGGGASCTSSTAGGGSASGLGLPEGAAPSLMSLMSEPEEAFRLMSSRKPGTPAYFVRQSKCNWAVWQEGHAPDALASLACRRCLSSTSSSRW